MQSIYCTCVYNAQFNHSHSFQQEQTSPSSIRPLSRLCPYCATLKYVWIFSSNSNCAYNAPSQPVIGFVRHGSSSKQGSPADFLPYCVQRILGRVWTTWRVLWNDKHSSQGISHSRVYDLYSKYFEEVTYYVRGMHLYKSLNANINKMLHYSCPNAKHKKCAAEFPGLATISWLYLVNSSAVCILTILY